MRELLEGSLTQAKLRNSAGLLLEVLRGRGQGELALEAWNEIAPRVGDQYWEGCDATVLTYLWCSFFFQNRFLELALQVAEEAEKILTEERYDDAHDELRSAQQLASALFNKGVSLGALDRPQEAIAVYDLVEERYGERDELQLAEQVASALNNKGVRLGALDRPQEAIAVYDLVEERYGERDELQLAEKVASALNNKGTVLSQLGFRERPGSDGQRQTWHQAETTFRTYAERTDKSLERVYNYACLLALSQQVAQALHVLEECLKAPPTISVEHVHEDPDWDPFRSLPEFRTLLERYDTNARQN